MNLYFNKKNKELLDLGWNVLVFYECDINSDIFDCSKNIKEILNA